MTRLQVEVLAADGRRTVTFEPHARRSGFVHASGAEVSDDVEVVDVPAIIGALFDLRPQVFEDRRVQLAPRELDARLRDGRARLLSLSDAGAEVAHAVVVTDEEDGHLLVEHDDTDQLRCVTLRSLDVWQLICAVAHDALEEG